ncbi:helix-turn-helix transcriptional regulator [Candidatus Contubernalis alkalaceticus]|uniref:helix-turn-helix transcriptional regulator n=1 Tax=Candidatus Contubernalis alkaliaceticus TaxID=338645 RepID=UPI00387EBA36|nr:helix-turn-helix transcriptional regulator [Candidatus Contubernalis alkalaceticus]
MISIVKNSVRLNRVEKKLTQEELAEKVSVTRQTIGLIEKGQYNPTIALCLKLCQVLDKSLDQLFWLEEDDDGK